MVRSVVDLPAPLEPSRVTISPCVDREATGPSRRRCCRSRRGCRRRSSIGSPVRRPACRRRRRVDASSCAPSPSRTCRGRPRSTRSLVRMSSGAPSAIFSPRSSTVIRSRHPHDHAHVVLDEQDRHLLLVPHPVHEVGEDAPTPAGSCRPSARPAAAPWAAARAPGPPPAAAGRRRTGCARTRPAVLPMPTNSSSSQRRLVRLPLLAALPRRAAGWCRTRPTSGARAWPPSRSPRPSSGRRAGCSGTSGPCPEPRSCAAACR